MKRIACLVLLLTLACPLASLADDFKAAFTDPAYNTKSIPKENICTWRGGQGASVSFTVSGIPAGADALVFEYSDKDDRGMNNGGHGKIGFRIAPGTASVVVPSFPGEVMTLPEGFFLIAPHKAESRVSKPGAYLAPCSNYGNKYLVQIKAVKLESEDGKKYSTLTSSSMTLAIY